MSFSASFAPLYLSALRRKHFVESVPVSREIYNDRLKNV